MAIPKRIYKGQPTATGGLLYTAPADGNGVFIKAIRAVNTDSSVRWLRLGTGGTGDADLLLPQWPIQPSGLVTDGDLVVLEPGQTIFGRAEVDAKVTVHIFGMEM